MPRANSNPLPATNLVVAHQSRASWSRARGLPLAQASAVAPPTGPCHMRHHVAHV